MLISPSALEALHRIGVRLDTVSIQGVQVHANHGVFPSEYDANAPFIVDTEVLIDTSLAYRGDDVAHTISYADLAQDACEVLSGKRVNLIETLAGEIADKALAKGALAVKVTVHKPEAPIDIPFKDASVTVRRQSNLIKSGTIREVIIALGANLGNPEKTFKKAIKQLEKLPLHVNKIAPIMENPAVLAPGQEAEPPYTNTVIQAHTTLSPVELLAELNAIEVRLGRIREEHWGSRYLDLDIITMQGITSDFPQITLPHPRAHERLFVLEPWQQILPEAKLSGRPIAEFIQAVK